MKQAQYTINSYSSSSLRNIYSTLPGEEYDSYMKRLLENTSGYVRAFASDMTPGSKIQTRVCTGTYAIVYPMIEDRGGECALYSGDKYTFSQDASSAQPWYNIEDLILEPSRIAIWGLRIAGTLRWEYAERDHAYRDLNILIYLDATFADHKIGYASVDIDDCLHIPESLDAEPVYTAVDEMQVQVGMTRCLEKLVTIPNSAFAINVTEVPPDSYGGEEELPTCDYLYDVANFIKGTLGKTKNKDIPKFPSLHIMDNNCALAVTANVQLEGNTYTSTLSPSMPCMNNGGLNHRTEWTIIGELGGTQYREVDLYYVGLGSVDNRVSYVQYVGRADNGTLQPKLMVLTNAYCTSVEDGTSTQTYQDKQQVDIMSDVVDLVPISPFTVKQYTADTKASNLYFMSIHGYRPDTSADDAKAPYVSWLYGWRPDIYMISTSCAPSGWFPTAAEASAAMGGTDSYPTPLTDDYFYLHRYDVSAGRNFQPCLVKDPIAGDLESCVTMTQSPNCVSSGGSAIIVDGFVAYPYAVRRMGGHTNFSYNPLSTVLRSVSYVPTVNGIMALDKAGDTDAGDGLLDINYTWPGSQYNSKGLVASGYDMVVTPVQSAGEPQSSYVERAASWNFLAKSVVPEDGQQAFTAIDGTLDRYKSTVRKIEIKKNEKIASYTYAEASIKISVDGYYNMQIS